MTAPVHHSKHKSSPCQGACCHWVTSTTVSHLGQQATSSVYPARAVGILWLFGRIGRHSPRVPCKQHLPLNTQVYLKVPPGSHAVESATLLGTPCTGDVLNALSSTALLSSCRLMTMVSFMELVHLIFGLPLFLRASMFPSITIFSKNSAFL